MSDATISKSMKRKRMRKRIRKLIIWLILIALAVGAVYLFVLPSLSATATTTYDSYTTTRGSISNSTSFSGTIDVVNDETLTAESAGTVRKIYVEEGEEVVQGQRLIRLSNGEILEAGFDGEVNEISVEEGDEVSANDELIEIVDFENLEVTINVDEYSMSMISVGLEVEVTVTALEQSFDSEITHINKIPSGGGSTSYYTVTAGFSGSEDVLPGMQVTVVIAEDEAEDAIILSTEALSFTSENSAYVLVMNDDGEMEQVEVEVGVDNDNYVEITSGLEEGVTVYVAVETVEESSGLSSLFSSLTTSTSTDAGGGDFSDMGGGMDMSNMGGGGMGGGMP